jgi:hypothetical protein
LFRLEPGGVIFEDIGKESVPTLEVQYDLDYNGIGLALQRIPLEEGSSLHDVLKWFRETFSPNEEYSIEDEAADLSAWLSLLMYLCSQGADVSGVQVADSGLPQRRRLKSDVAPARRADVGFRVGAAIRHSLNARRDGAPTGRSIAPHLRRAHWHTYYSGKGSRSDPARRTVQVKWMGPIAVGVGPVQPVVRPVNDGQR